jgi:hypothetical protein
MVKSHLYFKPLMIKFQKFIEKKYEDFKFIGKNDWGYDEFERYFV